MNKTQKGMVGIFEATLWLMENDYQVFHNLSHWGPVDLIGLKNGEIYLFDVKSAGVPLHPSAVTADQWELGVMFILWDGDTFRIEEPNPAWRRQIAEKFLKKNDDGC